MKKSIGCLCFSMLAAFAFTAAAFADTAPSQYVVIPEVIWAQAAVSGTWVTDVQINTTNYGTPIIVQFHYGTTFREVTLEDASDFAHQSILYTNILQVLQSMDSGFDYYGKVGALFIYTTSGNTLCAHAMVRNGNYGKTTPSFVVGGNTENTAAVGRNMIIMGTRYSAAYRTHAGFWNCTTTAMTVRFFVMRADFTQLGNYIDKTIPAYGFIAFDIFAEAGITSENINTILYIVPQSGGASGAGLYCFGSIANNYTNDTYALTAIPAH